MVHVQLDDPHALTVIHTSRTEVRDCRLRNKPTTQLYEDLWVLISLIGGHVALRAHHNIKKCRKDERKIRKARLITSVL
jgi:hypothetical protein